MTWQTQWQAISDRIGGLLQAGEFFARLLSIKSSDSYGVAKTYLLPHAQEIFEEIKKYKEDYAYNLSRPAIDSLDRFITNSNKYFSKNINKNEGLKIRLASLASFRAEFSYKLSDKTAIAKRITERAFVHIQRSIVADPDYREKWKKAFREGEIQCEKLGAAHLLLHGIWAFKASSEGERTDLILGEPPDLQQVESTSEALVLTEWKVVRQENEVASKAEEAFNQAKRYSTGSLAGFELTYYRYLVLVSEDYLKKQLDDKNQNNVIFKYIKIAVNPKVPSAG